MIKNYFKTTIRNFWRNKGYSSLNIFGLAIGIACAGLIFLWAEDEVTFDNANVKKDRLYQLNVNMTFEGNEFTMGSTPRPMAAAMKAEIPGIANTARYSDNDQQLLFSFNDKSLYAIGRYTDAFLFSMFTFDFVEGNAKTPFPQLHSLVITESAAKKFFGNEKNVIGKTVHIDNKQDYIISGVVKDMPENSTLQFEWLAPYEITFVDLKERGVMLNDAVEWGSYGPLTYVELDKNANLTIINNQLKDFIHRKAADQKSETFLFPMKDWRLYNEFANGKQTGGGRIEQVRMLSLIAWIILLIACINFMNLATARSEKRAKEVGVRKVLGSGKKSLIAQFMSETFMMSAIATLIAVLIMSISLPAFNILMQKNLVLNLTNPSQIIFLFIILFVCGLIAGSYPSLYLSSFNPVSVLKGIKMKTGSASFIRKGLVVTQFAVSVVFIISTIVVYMQIQHIKNRNLGFNKNNLVEISPQHDVSKIFPLIKNDLLHTGLIENATLADRSTLNGGNTDARFKWQGKSSDNQAAIAYRNVTPEFISTSGMQIIKGSDFSNNAASENSNVIINESMEKIMGKESAVGKIIQSPRRNPDGVFTDMTVIGVVKDYVYGNVYDGKAGPLIIFCKPPEYQNFIYARIKSQSDVGQALAKIAEVMKKDDPAYPLEYKFVDDQFNQMFQNETLTSKVSTVFAVLAIIISCLGLFSLAIYTAERRIKEIGVRKVLGASVSGITALLSKDFLQLVAIACLVAFPVAWWIMHDWLLNYEYRIEISWWIFFAAGFIAMVIALITVSFQAIKAAIANPVKSLRTE
ncbi:MAG TPA: ABC transporter permease [Chitinophagaceae bacterium]|jgi:ABC-type antimicrobial peptide transport system permease subunit|nr:ABC transporter permease [Chitinophagaceae bacterium]